MAALHFQLRVLVNYFVLVAVLVKREVEEIASTVTQEAIQESPSRD